MLSLLEEAYDKDFARRSDQNFIDNKVCSECETKKLEFSDHRILQSLVQHSTL